MRCNKNPQHLAEGEWKLGMKNTPRNSVLQRTLGVLPGPLLTLWAQAQGGPRYTRPSGLSLTALLNKALAYL